MISLPRRARPCWRLPRLGRQTLGRPRPERGEGQALVEFALALPLFTLVVLVTIQFSLLFVWYYSETRMARDTARWLAINASTTTDLAFAQEVQRRMLPGLVGGAPQLATSGSSSQDTVYRVGNMLVTFTPCLPSAGRCTHPARAAGRPLSVEMAYDARNIIFLPATFRLGGLAVGIPQTLPPHRVFAMAE